MLKLKIVCFKYSTFLYFKIFISNLNLYENINVFRIFQEIFFINLIYFLLLKILLNSLFVITLRYGYYKRVKWILKI